MKIAFTGGGTGGHIFPIIAVAREVEKIAQRDKKSLEMIFIGSTNGAEQLFADNNIKPKSIVTGKLRRYFSFQYLIDMPKILIGLVQSYIYLFFYMPDIIFSKGGYGSFPVVVIGWLFRIPVISHESDSISGLTTRVLAKFSKKIVVSFPGDYPELRGDKVVRIGNPTRDLRGGDITTAYKEFNITTKKPIILILGGSQGAEQINTLVISMLPKLTEKYEIIHQTGEAHYGAIYEYIKRLPAERGASYHPIASLNEIQMKLVLALSNIVISRAGSGAIFEIALTAKPSILIPLAGSAYDHQQRNAQIYQTIGACYALDSANLTDDFLLERIDSIINNPEKYRQLQAAAMAFSKPEAAAQIAQLILDYK
ncbi:MAG: UDP-N-acetylglucosamine--N-acetylmuramyl-(pentapeptide) pyrophosphoryl-undecaprenol N-acetylglucosamine transferase [Candidatus Spechtbacterales bacterium]